MEIKITINVSESELKILKGEIKKTKPKDTKKNNLQSYSEYARFFDESCPTWNKSAEYNLMFLRQQQQFATDILRTKGHLFLNDVYDMLGFKRTKAGQVVGWVYNDKNPNGDNFVDFGIFDIHDKAKRDFVNGLTGSILLDFNVDGNILDLIMEES